MLTTLQWYVFREMGKTFLLTSVGLTAVLGFGGGVMNLVEVDQVSPGQLLGLALIVLPVAGTLTLPVAALYSATVTYGRMSADNEFLACRASGINVGRLFAAPFVISVLSGSGTFYFVNYMIPGLIQDLNTFARAGIQQFVEQQIQSPERLTMPGGRFRLHADAPSHLADDRQTLVLSRVAVLETGDGEWRSVGAAERIELRFEDAGSDRPVLAGEVFGLTYFNREKGQWIREVGRQSIGRNEIPLTIKPRVKWLTLTELMKYRANPTEWPRVRRIIEEGRLEALCQRFHETVHEDFVREGRVVLRGVDSVVTVEATGVRRDEEHNGRIVFLEVAVTEARGGTSRRIRGREGAFRSVRGEDGVSAEGELVITGDVEATYPDASIQPVRGGRERLSGFGMPERVASSDTRADSDFLAGLDTERRPTVAALQRQARQERDQFVRQVTAELHSRLAFSASALVLVVLGASLGVLLRGASVLVAFGISFAPAMIVTVMNIMGRQLAEKPDTRLVGLLVLWGAIGVVAVADAWLIARVIRQ